MDWCLYDRDLRHERIKLAAKTNLNDYAETYPEPHHTLKIECFAKIAAFSR